MYIPLAFRVEDAAKLAAFIRQYSFATLITHDAGTPVASHLPMLFRAGEGPHGTLVSHMARANPQWRSFTSSQEVLVIFHGPHTYVSPMWYESQPAVPTWNYAAVHVYGIPRILSERERVFDLLRDTVAEYESSMAEPWSGELPDEFRDRLMQGIVAFEIPVSRIEGKFKLSQNRPTADIRGVIKALSGSDEPESQAVARMMIAECEPSREPGA